MRGIHRWPQRQVMRKMIRSDDVTMDYDAIRFTWTSIHYLGEKICSICKAAHFKLIEAEWRIYASVNYPSLVQIMACRLVGAKPLSEPMLILLIRTLGTNQWNPRENLIHFHSRKYIWKCLQKGVYLVSASYSVIHDIAANSSNGTQYSTEWLEPHTLSQTFWHFIRKWNWKHHNLKWTKTLAMQTNFDPCNRHAIAFSWMKPHEFILTKASIMSFLNILLIIW